MTTGKISVAVSPVGRCHAISTRPLESLRGSSPPSIPLWRNVSLVDLITLCSTCDSDQASHKKPLACLYLPYSPHGSSSFYLESEISTGPQHLSKAKEGNDWVLLDLWLEGLRAQQTGISPCAQSSPAEGRCWQT